MELELAGGDAVAGLDLGVEQVLEVFVPVGELWRFSPASSARVTMSSAPDDRSGFPESSLWVAAVIADLSSCSVIAVPPG